MLIEQTERYRGFRGAIVPALQTRAKVSGSSAVMFAGNFALFEHDGGAEKDPDYAEGSEREKRNQQDRHKCLLILILTLGMRAGGDIDHEFL
jgi:hypothetical protein